MILRREIVGVLGGTFDPVHLGHLHASDQVARVFSLRRVLLVPCASPPHKDPSEILPATHRLAMLHLAVERREGLEVSTLELDRGGTSYTIDTLRALRANFAVVFLLGMDALLELPTWHRHDLLLREFDLVAVDRPRGSGNGAPPRLGEEMSRRVVPVPCRVGAGVTAAEDPPGKGGRIYHLTIPPLAVSSSEVRARAAASLPLDGLVPFEVARYIQEQGLYR